jgi:hypothetical protein
MRNDGTVAMVDAYQLGELEQYSETYNVLSQRLLFAMADDRLNDSDFDLRLDGFLASAKRFRQGWRR